MQHDTTNQKVRRLRFTGAQEGDFIEFYREKVLPHLRITALVGGLVYLLFGIHDVVVYPEIKSSLLTLRYLVAGPFMVLTVVVLFYGRSFRLMQVLYGLSVTVVGACICLALFISRDPRQLYYTGLILTIIFIYAISGLRLKYAFLSCLGITVFFVVAGLRFNTLARDSLFNDIFGLANVNIIGLIACYLLERSWRVEFLQRLQTEQARRALEEANERLQYLSCHDTLTGLNNRRAFDEHLKTEWHRAIRHRYPLSLLMIDIDDFKKYNDTMGHLAGDEALKRIARVIQLTVNRPGDMVARYGGEEFVVLLVGTDKEGAMHLGEDIISRVRTMEIEHYGSPKKMITVSIGCSSKVPSLDDDLAEFIARADRALYMAKRQGKDRVACLG